MRPGSSESHFRTSHGGRGAQGAELRLAAPPDAAFVRNRHPPGRRQFLLGPTVPPRRHRGAGRPVLERHPCGARPPSPPTQAPGDPRRRAQGGGASGCISEEVFSFFSTPSWEDRARPCALRGTGSYVRPPQPAACTPREVSLVLGVRAKAGHPLGSGGRFTAPSPLERVQDGHALSRGTQMTRELFKVAGHEDNG